MRISNIQSYNTFLQQIKTKQKEIAKYTDQLTSGKRILSPSEDMVAIAKSLKMRQTNKEIDNFLNNITDVRNRQETAENAISNIYETAQDARVEIVRLLNHGVLDFEDAQIVDDYLQGLKKYIIEQANTQYGDVHLFAGTKSDSKAFESVQATNGKTYDGIYGGNEEVQKVPISKGYGDGYEVDATFNGAEALGTLVPLVDENNNPIVDSNGNQLKQLKIVKLIDDIHSAIQNGDLTQIDESILNDFDEEMKKIDSTRAKIGNQLKTMDKFEEQYNTFKTSYNEMISSLEDTDIAEVITKLEQSKVAYEASTAVFNQNKDLSLLKYFAA
ncbi:flagellar hook-associated protein 3 FlgL [Nitratiruptor sp. YY08-26]|uniref:flagellin N-terminal helical domain-containing protein n=1 Tax=unclassified Nitratiruptor TaxID=2624044 RepID=UPI001916A557|nr:MULTISPECIES: flagellin [unclassified Nitratiruptor]BCD61885.1 flagellar hook-associated protein 3 FlgL [Nitratiruptor sp. YY08-13]BCD65820.1 flagellar hook-associated protein 3 FlgL [Nitratiruptor sp. YY08-26]